MKFLHIVYIGDMPILMGKTYTYDGKPAKDGTLCIIDKATDDEYFVSQSFFDQYFRILR